MKNARGGGSKVSAACGRSSACARRIAASITARWPRCTPSKLPMATTALRKASTPGPDSPATTKDFLGGFEALMIGKTLGPGPARHRNHRLAVEHDPAVDGSLAGEPNLAALGDKLDDFDDHRDHVADVDRCVEV